MFLYLWINKYKHIIKTGINLSSSYKFQFIVEQEDENGSATEGRLECESINNINIFNEQIKDVKAIIGENGAGKSSALEALVNNFMTNHKIYFDGFLITDQYIFNRKGIKFSNDISNLNGLTLKEINNVDIINFNRSEANKVKKGIEDSFTHGQIASSQLGHLTIIHYSPLLNTDRIDNSEGVAGSTKKWETNYWRYFDYTTENCIVNDYYSLNIGEGSYHMTGESELLAHKSAESRRNLEFLIAHGEELLPFKSKINKVNFRLNDFYKRFWDSIDSYFKEDSRELGYIEDIIIKLNSPFKESGNETGILRDNLYTSYIYGALKYEYSYRLNFGFQKDSNAAQDAIKLFIEASKSSDDLKGILVHVLKESNFAKEIADKLIAKIESVIGYISNSGEIFLESAEGFSISIENKATITQLLGLIYTSFLFEDAEKSYVFNIFSIEYTGLSSGEKCLLSMFGRFKEAADLVKSSQTEIVFLLDEPEVALHPQWQTLFIDTINQCLPIIFKGKEIQIIITSHSPILISDLPKRNIVFLEKEDETGLCIISDLHDLDNTFAANIHSLYANAFFLKEKGGSMGVLARRTINKVIDLLHKDNPYLLNPDEVDYIRSIISSVGEPLIKDRLYDLFYSRFPEQQISNTSSRIEFLRRELEKALAAHQQVNGTDRQSSE